MRASDKQGSSWRGREDERYKRGTKVKGNSGKNRKIKSLGVVNRVHSIALRFKIMVCIIMHILQGDYNELFRTHQKSLRRKQRLSEERKEDCYSEATGSAHEAEKTA